MAVPSTSTGAANTDQELNLDSLVARLLEVRGQRAGKTVQMTETEVRALCLRSAPLDPLFQINSKLNVASF